MKATRVTVRLPVAQVQELREIVAPLELPVSYVLRSIIRAYLADVAHFKNGRQGAPRSLLAMFDVLGGAVRSIDQKLKLAEATVKAYAPESQERAAKTEKRLMAEASRLFDGFLSQGLDAKTALSRTNEALKASDFPWTSYETTRVMLRRAGRFKALPQGSASGRPDRVSNANVDALGPRS